jgi:hypothetical protein
MAFKERGNVRSGDHPCFKIVDSADISQFGKADHRIDVEFPAPSIKLAEVVFQVMDEIFCFFQRVRYSFVKIPSP